MLESLPHYGNDDSTAMAYPKAVLPCVTVIHNEKAFLSLRSLLFALETRGIVSRCVHSFISYSRIEKLYICNTKIKIPIDLKIPRNSRRD